MKTLILTAALPLLACVARGQNHPPDKAAPAETVRKAHAAAWLGVAMVESDEKVVIGQVVPGSPADKAGLKNGDRILRLADSAIEGRMQRVLKKVGGQKPGDTIELRYLRGDKEETVTIELAERPAQLDGDFRGEFRREKEKIELNPKEAVEDSKKAVEEAKEKLDDRIELDPFKHEAHPDLSQEVPKKDPKGKQPDGGKLFRYYLDRKWPWDKAGGKWDETELRLSFELPLFEWAEKNKKAAGKQEKQADDFKQLLRLKDHHPQEAAIWKRVQDTIARALKESNIGPDVSGKVMKAVEDARTGDANKKVHRARLEAEAAKLEKEMQSLKERSEKLREELKKSSD